MSKGCNNYGFPRTCSALTATPEQGLMPRSDPTLQGLNDSDLTIVDHTRCDAVSQTKVNLHLLTMLLFNHAKLEMLLFRGMTHLLHPVNNPGDENTSGSFLRQLI
ncbi:hypothetical protein Nepgr_020756 [Nepenthes gracilis]|uniref:Uncharacterized protein n=1 Tax=Nepenthes gracilis TaxID=150966 RepID=A0AAD3XWJ9_NEPGR|nr:hypothetical protein Nepgr_020756 [Nepenthes gracilis]